MISLLPEQSRTGDRLALDGLQLALFGGKGGVGKTTAAAAAALQFARSHPGQQVLLLSTDPAHSLADVIGQPIGADTVPVFDLPHAYACEFDACSLFRNLQEQARPALQMILEGGTYLSREEVQQFLTLTLPGLDELMALFKIAQLLQENRYDLVILDTAPTGHTLRLLRTPSWMETVLQALRLMEAKRQEIAGHLGRRHEQEVPERILNDWESQVHTIREMLADPARTGFYLVTLVDRLSLNETERLSHELVNLHLGIRALIVNRLLLKTSCGFCENLAGLQQQLLATLVQRLPDYPLFVCPWLDGEPTGMDALEQWSRSLQPYAPVVRRSLLSPAVSLASSATAGPPSPVVCGRGLPTTDNGPRTTDQPRLPDFITLGRRLLIFGGKGGVGKTTMAATAAQLLARRHPRHKVLLASIDPAHSLADCLEHPVGPDPVPMGPNLWAVEPDAESLFGEFHQTLCQEIDSAWERLEEGHQTSLAYDREIFEHLLALSPPGADEIMAISRITDFQQQGNFDLIVLDTPPTGHLVRFLELPEVIGAWTHLLLRWLLRWQKVSALKKTTNSLLNLARAARDLHHRLINPNDTVLVMVTTAELPAVEETCRLADTLRRLGISCRYVIANRLISRHDCVTCRSLQQGQERPMAILTSRLAGHVLVKAPLHLQKTSPQADLNRLQEVLYD